MRASPSTIPARERDRYEVILAKAIEQGAKVACGGGRPKGLKQSRPPRVASKENLGIISCDRLRYLPLIKWMISKKHHCALIPKVLTKEIKSTTVAWQEKQVLCTASLAGLPSSN